LTYLTLYWQVVGVVYRSIANWTGRDIAAAFDGYAK
jgi:hypothetical protein